MDASFVLVPSSEESLQVPTTEASKLSSDEKAPKESPKPEEQDAPPQENPRSKAGDEHSVETDPRSAILIPHGKETWFACLILSTVYALLFIATAQGWLPFGKGMLQGFCVWTAPSMGNLDDGRPEYCLWQNSHQMSWWVDAAMTVVIVGLYFRNMHKFGFQMDDLLFYGGMATSTFFHGFVHQYISGMNCVMPSAGGGALVGLVEYFSYTFMLCLMVFGFGFSNVTMWQNMKYSLVVSVLTVIISLDIEPEYSLSVLFAITHPLSSFMGTYGDTDYFSSWAGVFFLLATCAGIMELVLCEAWEKQHYGHVWYDFFLHLTVIVTLLTKPQLDDSKKKKKD